MSRTGLPDLVARWVARTPSAFAVRQVAGDSSLTYAELWHRAGALAGTLGAGGTAAGGLVAVAATPSVDLVVAALGILRAGGAYVPLDPHAPRARIETILREAGDPPVVVASGAAGDVWRDRLPAGTVPIPVPDHGDPDFAGVEVGGDSPAYVSFTSGSTGRPKGVVVPHRAVARLVLEPNFCQVDPGDRVASMANPAFDATTFELWNTLTAGGTVVALPTPTDLQVDEWIRCVGDEAIDTMFLTTSMFHTIARERPDAFASVRNVLVGGEQLDIDLARKVLAAAPPDRLVNAYGPTETTTFAASFECTPDNLRELTRVPIGFALQQTALLVLDDGLDPVPDGDVGELCIGGPGVALGYLGQPELTGRRFVTEPRSGATVYRTGDLVRTTPGGALEVLGRVDRQVKIRGFRIELEEIETAVSATGLAEAAFVEKVGEGASAGLVGFVLPADGAQSQTLAGELRERLARGLPGYMIPTRWVPLDTVPLTPTGKADRRAMLEMLAPPGEPRVAAPAPAEEPFAAVAEAVTDVLGVPEVGPADNFLDLGGDSMLAVRTASRLSARMGVEVDPAELLLSETLGEFAATIPAGAAVGS